VERLERFLDGLGDPSRVAFEFRHPTWFEEATYDCLRSRGAALCVADTDEEDADIVETAPWGYLRLRKADYPEAALIDWAERVRGTGWDRCFVFFKHEDAAAGPHMAERFMALG
jgi:uncharacterized protein YecE (DUF72 family)